MKSHLCCLHQVCPPFVQRLISCKPEFRIRGESCQPGFPIRIPFGDRATDESDYQAEVRPCSLLDSPCRGRKARQRRPGPARSMMLPCSGRTSPVTISACPLIYSIVPPNDGSALRHGHHFEPVDFVIDHGRGHHDAYSAGSCQRIYARAYGCRQRPRRHREELIESERRWSGREAFVTMMQTADLGQGNDRSRPGRLNGSSIRCVLAERQVGP